LKWDEERSASLISCLLKLIHEDDAALAIVASEVVVDSRSFFPSVKGEEGPEDVRLVSEICAVNAM
jgi:hypothetical protein